MVLWCHSNKRPQAMIRRQNDAQYEKEPSQRRERNGKKLHYLYPARTHKGPQKIKPPAKRGRRVLRHRSPENGLKDC